MYTEFYHFATETNENEWFAPVFNSFVMCDFLQRNSSNLVNILNKCGSLIISQKTCGKVIDPDDI